MTPDEQQGDLEERPPVDPAIELLRLYRDERSAHRKTVWRNRLLNGAWAMLVLLLVWRVNSRADEVVNALDDAAYNDCVENVFDANEANYERGQALLFVALAVEGLDVPPPESDTPLPTLVQAVDAILTASEPPTSDDVTERCGVRP